MGWETMYDKIEITSCACGNGKVERHNCKRGDDWNRRENYIYGEKILCDKCDAKYKIETVTKHHFCPSWKGDGIVVKQYLVPKNCTLNISAAEKSFNFKFDEKIISLYSKNEISSMIDDMKKNKFSTRVEYADTKNIIDMYYRKYKKKRLSPIIDILIDSLFKYETYEWTKDRMEQFRVQEAKEIKRKEIILESTLSKSYFLDF